MDLKPVEKSDLKKQIQALKAEIAEAIRAKDRPKTKKLRRHVKRLKSQSRRLTSAKASSVAPAAEPTPTPAT